MSATPREAQRFPSAPAWGFTLVEMILVIVLIAILSAFALPRFFDENTFMKRGFHDEVVAALRYAQKLAVTTHCQVRVTVDGSGFQLEQPAVSSECGGAISSWDPVRDPSGAGSFSGAKPTGVAVSGGTVVFQAIGSTQGATTTIAIGGRSIKVWQTTGYVEKL